MTNSERRRMRKLWRMREREIERLNNPRRMIFVSDVLLMGLFSIAGIMVLLGGMVGLCHVMHGIQILFGVA